MTTASCVFNMNVIKVFGSSEIFMGSEIFSTIDINADNADEQHRRTTQTQQSADADHWNGSPEPGHLPAPMDRLRRWTSTRRYS